MADEMRPCRACGAESRRAASATDGMCTEHVPTYYEQVLGEKPLVYLPLDGSGVEFPPASQDWGALYDGTCPVKPEHIGVDVGKGSDEFGLVVRVNRPSPNLPLCLQCKEPVTGLVIEPDGDGAARVTAAHHGEQIVIEEVDGAFVVFSPGELPDWMGRMAVDFKRGALVVTALRKAPGMRCQMHGDYSGVFCPDCYPEAAAPRLESLPVLTDEDWQGLAPSLGEVVSIGATLCRVTEVTWKGRERIVVKGVPASLLEAKDYAARFLS